ncbi:uncharacterized protein BXIN_0449 [Babesia sp. Xinjiang]|uniref:uncharacterized protein n=1 Tax=Babesia sp. Xinjiang TaxID=462227 RepID=UPI000A2626DE|nr:uncharacterized protein BXIN_0449 [Babesia sp. Xinjiang]ORM41117.1 hypothetical protein BXIN_0449 [Babesia sp. Xinjiang]
MVEPGFVYYRKKELTDDRFENLAVKSTKKKGQKQNAPKAKARGEPEVKKDRVLCGCGGHLHKCFSNCMGCGKILCVKEGAGPCFHCNTFVFAVCDADMVPREYADDPEFQKAIELRDRLLAQDDDYAAQSLKVHDLHTDWFREANSVFNENADQARLMYYQEEARKRAEAAVQHVDIDLSTGQITSSSKHNK